MPQEALRPGDGLFGHYVRILGASVNAKIADVLVEARRKDPDGGWLFLSQIAVEVSEKPGTVGLAIQKLLPLLEEKREKGRRWFRSRYTDLRLVMARV
jgi:hypothetical protein